MSACAPEDWLEGAVNRLGFGVVGSLEEVPPAATLLVHVTGSVERAVASLGAFGARIAARDPESVLFLAELTHDGPPDESLVAAEHVEAVREALGARERGHAALVAVRPDGALEESFPFTRLVVTAAEAADDARASRLSQVVERLGAMPERHTVAQGYAHVRGPSDFELGWNEGPSFAPLLALADGARAAHEWDHAIAGYRAVLLVAREARERASVYGRIGATERARGELREAKRAYEKALALAPDDRAALTALVALAHDLGDWGRYITLARAQVEHLDTSAEKADLHFAIARALVERSRDLAAAVVELEKARALEPRRDDVLEALRRAYRVLGDWKKLLEITGVLADEGPSDAERSARRFAQAKIARDKLGDAQLAIAFLDAALTEDPTNDEALDVLIEVRTSRGEAAQLARQLEELVGRYDAMGDTERAADGRRCLEGLRHAAPANPPPAPAFPSVPPTSVFPGVPLASATYPRAPQASAPALFPLEGPLEGPVEGLVEGTPAAGGTDRAPPIPESVPSLELLDALPSEPDLSELMANDAVRDRESARGDSEASPSEMLRAAGEITGQMPALPPTLEELPPDSLLDYEEPEGTSAPVGSLPEPAVEIAARPQAMLEAEVDAGPVLDLPIFVAGETGLHSAIAAETIPSPVPVDDDSVLLELEESVARTPLDAILHARLFAIHTQAGRIDRAYLSALALEELGATTEEHEAALDQSRPEGPIRLRALLDGPAWDALRAPGSDDVIESLFGSVAPAAITAQIEDRRARRKLATLDPERKQSTSSTVSIVASFQWAARVLGVACPDLYVLDDVPGDIAAVPTKEPSTALGPRVLSGLSSKELSFLAARHLTYYRREYAPLVHFSSLPELTLLVLACVQMELPAVPIPHSAAASVAAHRGRIARHLAETDRSSMATAVQRLESRGGRLDLAGWVGSVELTSARAGLFLCGDLRSAMSRLRAEESVMGSAAFARARADLIAFTASRAHAELRSEFALIASPRASGLRSRDEVVLRGVDRTSDARAV